MDDISPEMADAARRQIKGACIAWGDGKAFNFDNPNPEVITLEDAAYALAYTVRWRGQTRSGGRRCFFSVAQHCTYGAEEMLTAGHGAANALGFLWHEPDEIVLPDLGGPVKPRVPGYRELAKLVGGSILCRFGITIPDPDLCKTWDLRMMVTEKRDLMPGHGLNDFLTSTHQTIRDVDFPPFARRIVPYPHPDQAAARFMILHAQLSAEVGR